MKKFFIIYKDDSVIEGTISCTEESFIDRFITPWADSIVSYGIEDDDTLSLMDSYYEIQAGMRGDC